MIKIILSLIMAAAPALFLVNYFYKKDKQKPEPKDLILKILILGILSVIPLIIIEITFQSLGSFIPHKPFLYAFFNAFIVAALCEETFKFLIVKIFVYNRKEFDEEVDGIIYCVIAGLGFACMENILYVLNNGIIVAVIRAFTAIPLHALAAGIMGYYIGKAKFTESKTTERILLMKGLFLAVLIHGIYDFILMAAPEIDYYYGPVTAAACLIGLFPFLGIIFFILKSAIITALKNDRANNRS